MGNNRLLKAVILAGVAGGLLAAPASAQSLTDRFKGLFGGKPDEPAAAATPGAPEAQDTGDLTCPPVTVRAGASTYAVAPPGKQPVGNDLRFQATITKMARECTVNGGIITARIGIQGRVIAGPAGAPSVIQVPIRVAVVQGGVNEKTIATKAYQTSVNLTETGSDPFTLVAEDLTYPAPPGAVGDSYIFYVGFDPQSLKPERAAPAPHKKKQP
jgi:hypothetical protein